MKVMVREGQLKYKDGVPAEGGRRKRSVLTSGSGFGTSTDLPPPGLPADEHKVKFPVVICPVLTV